MAQPQARDTGRTNKTLVGARRQTIIVSVLESLRLYLPTFTLPGDRGDRALVASGPKLLQQTAAEAEVESARPLSSRQAHPHPRRLTL